MAIRASAHGKQLFRAVVLTASLALLSVLLPPPPARATNLVPTTTQELIDFIIMTNNNGADDTIDLDGQTFTLTTVNSDDGFSGPNGLPIVLADNGHRLTIKNGTIQRTASAPDFRVLQMDAGTSLTLDGVTIKGGRSARDGGGLRVSEGDLTLTHATITDNASTGQGGGVSQSSGTLIIESSIVSGNTSSNRGGGLLGSNASITVDRTTISGNSAATTGGGMQLEWSSLTMTASTVSGNTAEGGGGGMSLNNSWPVRITSTTLSGNQTQGSGGAMSLVPGTRLEVVGSTISGNGAGDTAGIFGIEGATIWATIISNGAQVRNCTGSNNTLGANLADDASCFADGGTNRVVAAGAILLGPLADNGGPTQTHRLLDGSPAIDFVQGQCTTDGTDAGQPLTTDQRGQPRLAGARCDAGAVERQGGVLQLSASTYTVSEAAGSASIQVVRTGGTEGGVGASLTPTDGSATAGSDYTGGPRTVTVADGQASATVAIPLTNDSVSEPDETVNLTLSAPTGGTSLGARTSATLTITNDDPVVLSVASSPVPEGNSGTSNATFTVTRTGYAATNITVQYATTDGTAKAGSDYTATSGTLTFAPNESSRSISVPILGDTLFEPDESFTVTLSNPTNAVLGTAQAVGIIQNDDVAVACAPRPRVTQTATASGGALNVHIEATPLNTATNNRVQQIRFGTFQNATVTLDGQNVTSGQAVSMPVNSVAADFVVRRVATGQATTVHFTVVDSCGSWATFVGGGAGAGF